MGRAGRAAPRTCSTLELRTHAFPLTVSVPAATSKQVLSSPASPGTPIQNVPASVRAVRLAWPEDALQAVQRHVVAIRLQSIEVSEPSSRKRSYDCSEVQEAPETSQNEDACGLEVALQSKPALPEDWEQFLDLKTGQFYYFNWSSCKKARRDPRKLICEANNTVREHMREAHIRGESSLEQTDTTSSQNEESDENEVNGDEPGSCPPDVCERTSEVCSVAPARCAVEELGDGDSLFGSNREEHAANSYGKMSKSQQTVMVVSGCQSCSMFVMLCLSSPACPSCGVLVPSEHCEIR
ncbi:uncharacterized protein [Physcomitrium patens]|uniref:WW domain-containing protein n=1 Tax=Physcomitrium patens TaxID=3218 RepID=A0A2K1JHR9_PHYPA|nr:uncharacterized protein LOC112291883 [Physcomitrium patens]PNR41101.1 hypothetical protein PHYPA_018504 [Physcomitrium patens]|eukprot:XP_024395604.1 uncharacterized protein LOC112291883 [Physcomitrella patens]